MQTMFTESTNTRTEATVPPLDFGKRLIYTQYHEDARQVGRFIVSLKCLQAGLENRYPLHSSLASHAENALVASSLRRAGEADGFDNRKKYSRLLCDAMHTPMSLPA